MVRWRPLTEYLRRQDDDVVELTYDAVADILGGPLPASATNHRPVFWSNAETGGYARHWRAAGFRTQLRGLADDQVRFVRIGTVRAGALSGHGRLANASVSGNVDVLLVGCVKTKAETPRQARDLYMSPLFARRRAYAEASGKPWLILSAEHGVVHPSDIIEPYDRFLEEQPVAYQRRWGRTVIAQLEEHFESLDGMVFELHASAAYGDPIEEGLQARGARLMRPLAGARFGEQLAWYDRFSTTQPRGRDLEGGQEAAVPPPPPSIPTAPSRVLERSSLLSHGRPEATAEASTPDPVHGKSSHHRLAWRITAAFTQGQLDFSGRRADAPSPGWRSMPEVRAIETVRRLGASPTGIRRFLTFISAMDRARDADALWLRGSGLYEEAPWVFNPDAVAKRRFTELGDVLRRTGVSQRHGSDVAAWRTIAESLVDAPADDPIRVVIERGHGEAPAMLDGVQATTGSGGRRYPLLQGPKIRTMWVRILAHPGGADIAGLDVLPVAVDVQVRRVTENLAVTDTAGRNLDEVRATIQAAWDDHVRAGGAVGPAGLENTGAALDPALWFWGKWGCSFCERLGHKQPIHDVCRLCRFGDEAEGLGKSQRTTPGRAASSDRAGPGEGAVTGGNPERSLDRGE